MDRCARVCLVAAIAFAVVGCGSTDKAAPPGSGSSSTAPTDSGCRAGDLHATLGQGGGAAGSVIFPLIFTNTGSKTCVLDGFPGVSYVNEPHGDPVGPAADRTGDTPEPVRLAPGGQASALLRAVNVQNYPEDICGPTPVKGLRVYPPNDVNSLFIAYPATACSKTGPNIHQLTVGPVTPGARA
ncbi:DUF4232 domain-containing protein [Skermania sp. ID1734]|uniref:DUF4232 domain-containing protein n=1 Tax=Skermania sp. ID1734 TaxID=2597516 RepID=UPI00117DAED4|nr:DUF4232 domain-containing protein [Skermania sp. ID1734]TSD93943.1 DUF4232 domain-containing protein [Skermania sp. ID1734]